MLLSLLLVANVFVVYLKGAVLHYVVAYIAFRLLYKLQGDQILDINYQDT